MNKVTPSKKKCCVHLEPQDVTLLENRVFADIIKIRIKTRSYWIRESPKSNDSVFIRDRNKAQTEGECHVKTEAETRAGVMQLKAK